MFAAAATAVDFSTLSAASSVSGVYAMIAIVWGLFALLPVLVGLVRIGLDILPQIDALLTSARPGVHHYPAVKTARNGRLYAVVPGRPPVWARRGETSVELAARAAVL